MVVLSGVEGDVRYCTSVCSLRTLVDVGYGTYFNHLYSYDFDYCLSSNGGLSSKYNVNSCHILDVVSLVSRCSVRVVAGALI